MNTREVILKAREKGKCVPAFNVPHIPMVKPIIEAIRDENSVAMIQVARVEWEKMKAESLERIAEEYDRYKDPAHTLLHLDHVPVIDEDYQRVDYRSLIERAIRAGYQSVMIDGSRLPLEENISATREAADLAHAAQIPCEAELGAVMGHENKVMPPYEEIFASKMGFTRLDEAKRLQRKVSATGCPSQSATSTAQSPRLSVTRKSRKPKSTLRTWQSSTGQSAFRLCCTAAPEFSTSTFSTPFPPALPRSMSVRSSGRRMNLRCKNPEMMSHLHRMHCIREQEPTLQNTCLIQI